MLWIDKYRPDTLDKLTLHPETTALLKNMAACKNMPHMLFFGPSGSGRKTRVSALLREVYGPGAAKLRVEQRQVRVSAGSSTTVDVSFVGSNFHVELNPSDAGYYDRVVIQETIKEIAQTRPMDSAVTFKTIVVHEADKMTREAQDALRRTMERYMRTCRIVLVATGACRVTAAIRSRCFQVRLPPANEEEVVQMLMQVSEGEKLKLPEALARSIAAESEGNLRKAVLMLEATKTKQHPFVPDQQVERADWEEYVSRIALDIAQEQTPKKLAEVRMKLYELLTHLIPPELVLKRLTMELLRKVDSQLQHDLVRWAAFYEHRIHLGTKPIYHIEAFVAKFMSLYSTFLAQAFA